MISQMCQMAAVSAASVLVVSFAQAAVVPISSAVAGKADIFWNPDITAQTQNLIDDADASQDSQTTTTNPLIASLDLLIDQPNQDNELIGDPSDDIDVLLDISGDFGATWVSANQFTVVHDLAATVETGGYTSNVSILGDLPPTQSDTFTYSFTTTAAATLAVDWSRTNTRVGTNLTLSGTAQITVDDGVSPTTFFALSGPNSVSTDSGSAALAANTTYTVRIQYGASSGGQLGDGTASQLDVFDFLITEQGSGDPGVPVPALVGGFVLGLSSLILIRRRWQHQAT